MGCIHTSQGLEFDWMGVLIGDDLVYRDGAVRGEPAKRARTDKSLHGWTGEFRAAKDDPAAREKVLANEGRDKTAAAPLLGAGETDTVTSASSSSTIPTW